VPARARGPGAARADEGTRTARALALAVLLAAGCRDAPAPRIGLVMGGDAQSVSRLVLEDWHASADPAHRGLSLVDFNRRYTSDAAVALATAESLAAMPAVVAVVGHSNSSASIIASQVYNARHLVQVAPTSTSPLYREAGPWSFRLVGGDDRQAEFLADEVVKRLPARVAVMHVNDDYGRALRQLLFASLKARGVAVAYDGSYVEGEPFDADEATAAIAHARPTLLVWLGRSPQFGRLVDSLRAALPTLPILASDGFGSPTLVKDPRHRFDGIRYVRLVDVAHGSPALQSLRAPYRQLTGTELTDQAALSYDALMLLAQATREAGADRAAIRSWLTALGKSHPAFPGVTGPIAFNEHGERVTGYTLVTVGDTLRAGTR